MAEFQKVVKEWNRMCYVNSCSSCPIGQNKSGFTCKRWTLNYPNEAERVILRWASEHPIMTNRRKFEEVFGFNIATMFEVNRGNAGWLDEEYKGGDGNV